MTDEKLPIKRLVNTQSACYMLRCNTAQLRQYVSNAIIKPIKPGAKRMFDFNEIVAFLSKREKLLTGF
jgi:hypothetical protein